MEKFKTSILSNTLIWFGAGVSIAEILTGVYIAPLGFKKGLLAIIIGHLIGAVLLYLAGIIGAKTEKSAMDTVKLSFGQKGSFIFSGLNILQLIGWTAVMIINGALAASGLVNGSNKAFWCILIGAMIIVWILIGIKNLEKVNVVVLSLLFILTVILSTIIFKGTSTVVNTDVISFGLAVELTVAMPLSWLPLISDYTSKAKDKQKSTIASVSIYTLISTWMFIIGMGATIYTGKSDIATILQEAGLGVVGLIIVVFSTVTTTFLDSYSAGVSGTSINKKIDTKKVAVAATVIGTIIAIFVPNENYESFLYFISSVFAPMIAILITDYFILKKDNSKKSFDLLNIVIYIIGFTIYRIFINFTTVIGITVPVIILTILISLILNFIIKKIENKRGENKNV